ncbi:hypothetical protein TNCV_3704541 [Trichonephila clavipes]|nr:hypothetical protein TNCV_3704541 [Trichonephila clavipes]
METGDKKWVTYYNIVRKRSWSKCGEAAQTVAKPGLTARKVLLCIRSGDRAAIPFVTNRDPPDTPQQSELGEVVHYHPSE